LEAAQAAADLYGAEGATCDAQLNCRAAYLTAMESLSQIHSEAGQHVEVLKLTVDCEMEIRTMLNRDPNNHLLLRQLRHLQFMEGLALQATNQIPEALAKLQESVNTGVQIEATGSANPDSICSLIQARIRYASLLALKTPKEAESEWNEARKLISLTSASRVSMCQQVRALPNLERLPKSLLQTAFLSR
jgi:hypothetical protein